MTKNDGIIIELNQQLSPDAAPEGGELLRLHFYKDVGQAVVKPDENAVWNHQAVRKAIYNNMPEGWGRYVVRTIYIENYEKVLIGLERVEVKDLAEAWTMYLGGVISDPPVMEF